MANSEQQRSNLDFLKKSTIQNAKLGDIIFTETPSTPQEFEDNAVDDQIGMIDIRGLRRIGYKPVGQNELFSVLTNKDYFLEPSVFLGSTSTSITLDLDNYNVFDLLATDSFNLNITGGRSYATYHIFITQDVNAPNEMSTGTGTIDIPGGAIDLKNNPGDVNYLKLVYFNNGYQLLTNENKIITGGGGGGSTDKYIESITGTGTTQQYNFVHNLGTENVTFSIKNGDTGELEHGTGQVLDLNNFRITANLPNAVNYSVTIIG